MQRSRHNIDIATSSRPKKITPETRSDVSSRGIWLFRVIISSRSARNGHLDFNHKSVLFFQKPHIKQSNKTHGRREGIDLATSGNGSHSFRRTKNRSAENFFPFCAKRFTKCCNYCHTPMKQKQEKSLHLFIPIVFQRIKVNLHRNTLHLPFTVLSTWTGFQTGT